MNSNDQFEFNSVFTFRVKNMKENCKTIHEKLSKQPRRSFRWSKRRSESLQRGSNRHYFPGFSTENAYLEPIFIPFSPFKWHFSPHHLPCNQLIKPFLVKNEKLNHTWTRVREHTRARTRFLANMPARPRSHDHSSPLP